MKKDGNDTDGFDAWEEGLDEAPGGGLLAPRKRKFWTTIAAALLATLAVVGLLLVHVWSRYRVLRLGYEVAEMSRERESLLEENRRLRIELQVLTRVDRLEPVARRQLGLAPPTPEQLLYVPGGRLPLPGPALDAPVAGARLPDGPQMADRRDAVGVERID